MIQTKHVFMQNKLVVLKYSFLLLTQLSQERLTPLSYIKNMQLQLESILRLFVNQTTVIGLTSG